MSAGRHLGLLGATGVGVGAIVGGGILALAGVAFATTGPSAILAFALNGLIAGVTALSFAEMSARFPESGGTYTFAKKVLSVEAAFMVGWVMWFASIVAAVLYALGFATFAVALLDALWVAGAGGAPVWLGSRSLLIALAIGAASLYAVGLVRRSGGGGQWATAGKVIVFALLIVAGLAALGPSSVSGVRARLTPFFAAGGLGLLQAMGYTFIALQGFDLIAAVGGEVKDPARNLPRAMLLSLAIALAIYLPLLFVIATAGVPPGASIVALSEASPETLVATAAGHFAGRAGFWLVIAAGLLSMLSALRANLYGASRVAQAMARDRTLPHALSFTSRAGTPVAAVLATGAAVAAILVVIPDVAAAGAAASLIFLISFAMVHWTNALAHRRAGRTRSPFPLPWFPLIPAVGAAACLGLALYQGFAVRTAGLLATLWLGLGVGLYFTLLAPRARVVDASALALDPELVRLRGRSPIVLVPIANPANAEALVSVANALVVPQVGRVVLLSVVQPPAAWTPGELPRPLRDAQEVLGKSLAAAFAGDLAPEALVSVAPDPWIEISRVARLHRCESLLVGLGRLEEEQVGRRLEQLMSRVDCDVVVLRAPPGWHPAQVRRVLVPLGGRRDHSDLRARLLGSLCRTAEREIRFVRVLPERAPAEVVRRAGRELRRLARDEVPGRTEALIVQGSDPATELAPLAAESDLVILGLQRHSRRRKVFGALPQRLVREIGSPLILISRRG